jgi:hypothetical protein
MAYSSKELSGKPNQIRLRMRSLVGPFSGDIEHSATRSQRNFGNFSEESRDPMENRRRTCAAQCILSTQSFHIGARLLGVGVSDGELF